MVMQLRWRTLILAGCFCLHWCFKLYFATAPKLISAPAQPDHFRSAEDRRPPESPTAFKGIPPFKIRKDLGKILEQENMTIGAELGVRRGYFAHDILLDWTSCEEYHLVDLWAHQENYEDISNVDDAKQDANYVTAMQSVDPWAEKIHICKNYTTSCAEEVPDDHFDFVYVDARHDFKGVYDDIVAWWPKLRSGGIMAGHDYVTQDDGPSQSRQDWTVNYDGTRDETRTVVKGAVDKFAKSVCRQVVVSYREASWNTWALRK